MGCALGIWTQGFRVALSYLSGFPELICALTTAICTRARAMALTWSFESLDTPILSVTLWTLCVLVPVCTSRPRPPPGPGRPAGTS